MQNPKQCIDEIIVNTFKAIQDAYNYQKENDSELGNPNSEKLTRIVFPKKRDKTTRISEQELRCIFIEQLNKKINDGWDVYYSVETPTQDTYSGFSKGEFPRQDNNGRSGEFDLVIFNNQLKRIALIEFKANNSTALEHLKDFVKLNNPNEGNALKYFIEIVKSYHHGTLLNLRSKTKGCESMFRCWSLDKGMDITKDICIAQINK